MISALQLQSVAATDWSWGAVGEGQFAVVGKHIVRERRRGQFFEELAKVAAVFPNPLFDGLLVSEEFDEILIRQVAVDAVGDEDVLEAVEVVIGDKRAPTPIGGGHPGDLPDLAEDAVAVVAMEHVAHELMVEIVLEPALIRAPRVERRGRFQTPVLVGQHVGDVDFGEAVVVDIGHVGAHRREADVAHPGFDLLTKRAVAVVDVEIIALEEIVRNINVEPAVAVDVADGDAEAEADLAAVDAGGFADVDERAALP